MRLAVCLAIFLPLAACGGAGAPSSPSEQMRASFPAGGVVNVIAVDAVDRLPLRQAELISPDGHATAANSVTANPAPTQSFSPQFPGGSYSSADFGVSSIGSNALSPGVIGTAPQSQTQLLAVVSTASITLPDPVAYRRDWQKFRIRLRFGDPPQAETREIAAPAPPAPS
jgi:hypothetical protein